MGCPAPGPPALPFAAKMDSLAAAWLPGPCALGPCLRPARARPGPRWQSDKAPAPAGDTPRAPQVAGRPPAPQARPLFVCRGGGELRLAPFPPPCAVPAPVPGPWSLRRGPQPRTPLSADCLLPGASVRPGRTLLDHPSPAVLRTWGLCHRKGVTCDVPGGHRAPLLRSWGSRAPLPISWAPRPETAQKVPPNASCQLWVQGGKLRPREGKGLVLVTGRDRVAPVTLTR